jgi:uncharacterized protein YuzE
MPKAEPKNVKGAEIDVTSVTGKNRSVDVLYVRLLNDKVHKTYELVEDEMLLDCNRDGEFVGVEILLPEKMTGARRKPKAKKVRARAKKAAGRVKKAVGRAKKAIRRAKRARSK